MPPSKVGQLLTEIRTRVSRIRRRDKPFHTSTRIAAFTRKSSPTAIF